MTVRRAFLDANVLFSATNSSSRRRELIDVAASVMGLVTCDYAVAEARRNLRRKRPSRTDSLDAVLLMVRTETTTAFKLPVRIAAKDLPILASAAAAGCGTLVTGDLADFGHLFGRTVLGVRIETPLDFVGTVAAAVADSKRPS